MNPQSVLIAVLVSALFGLSAFAEELQRPFPASDTDGNGTLSLAELVAGPVGKKLGAEKATETFKTMDVDKNGAVTHEEFLAVLYPDHLKAKETKKAGE